MRESLSLALRRSRWMTSLGLAVLAFGLSGCLYQDLQVIEVQEFSEIHLSLDGLAAHLAVDVYNPNPYAVTVQGADVRLRVDEEVVGDVTLAEGVTIRPEAQARVLLEVQTRDGALGRVLKNDLMNLLRGVELPFVAEGNVTGKAFGLTFRFPLRHEQTLNLR